MFDFTDEADILFDKRHNIDRKIKYAYTVAEDGSVIPVHVDEPIEPRVAWFDIEVMGVEGEVPSPSHAIHPIVTIQVMDSYTKQVKIFTYVIPDTCGDDIHMCTSEQMMIREFCQWIEQQDFDILSGWYSNQFDLPYIIQRAQVIGVTLKGLCRTYMEPSAQMVNNSWRIHVHGRQCLDLMEAFKKYYAPQGQLAAYDLKGITASTDILGDAAFTYEDYGPHIPTLVNERRFGTLAEYCRNDVRALDTINTKLGLIQFFEHLRMIAGVKIEETLMNSRVIESLLMHGGIKPMPTKNYKDTPVDGFEGAIVLTPPTGVHDNVGVVDLTALYPNIMVGFNISPDIDGVVPRTLKIIMEERDKLRRLKLEGKATQVEKNKETVLKFLANSFYGVIGWSRFRLYNHEQAATVTRIGRELNQFLQQVIRDAGYTPIYGDTDSVFALGVKTPEDGLALQSYANRRLEEWSHAHKSSVVFTLKFEKLYRKIVFKKSVSGEVAKKRYAGHLIWKDGHVEDKLDYTGIEIKRSDQANITKDLLEQFLLQLLILNDQHGAITQVRTLISNVMSGKVSVHDVSIPKGIKSMDRNDPWVHGINTCKELFHESPPDGVKPRLLYIIGDRKYLCIYPDMDEQVIRSKVTPDWGMIVEKTIRKKLQTYVESIGLKWEQAIHGQLTLM